MKSAGILSPFLTSCINYLMHITDFRPFFLKLALISGGYVDEVFKQQCHGS